MPRPVVWFELPVVDVERAQRFYGLLFGWGFGKLGDYDSTYWIIDTGGVSIAGGLVPVEHAEHPSVSGRSLATPTIGGAIVYVDVEDLGLTVSEAISLGGSVVRPPTLISADAGSFAQIRDTEGNLIGLWSAGAVIPGSSEGFGQEL